MSTLARAQHEFLACVLDDSAPLPAAWGARHAAGMAVYRNAYRARLVDALRETFERTARLVGEDAFRRAAAHHLITRPPTSWTIDLAGEGFAATCAELFANDPDVGELAWLEWAMHRAFTADDAEAMQVAGFAAATANLDADQWDALVLEFLPGTALRPVTHDLVKLWVTLGSASGEADLERLLQPEYVLLWREGDQPVFVLVPEHDGQALAALQRGGSFGEMCAALAARVGPADAAAMAGAMLLSWLELGVVRSIRTA